MLHVPPGRGGSLADEGAELATHRGRAPEPEQHLAMDALTAYDKRGRFLTIEAGIEGPRQSTGKTGGVMLPILFWTCLKMREPDLVTWTSHLAATHLASFREVAGATPKDDAGLINSNGWLRSRVKSVSWENGAESVSFTSGAVLEFSCRSSRQGRGRSGVANFADEALFLAGEAMAAMLPKLATRSMHGDARQYYASSGPKAESAYLRSLIRRAAARDETLTWVAWRARGSWAKPGCVSAECSHEYGVSGCSLDDEDRWAEANILLGRRTSVEFLRTMRRSMPALEFGREFLGWGEGDDVVSIDAWQLLADPGSVPLRRPVALAVDVAPRLKSAAVLVAAKRADGRVHVEILEHARGVGWLPEFLAGLQREKFTGIKVRHLAGKAPVMAVVPDLVAAGVDLEPMTDTEFAAACGGCEQLVSAAGLRHLGEARLTSALGAAAQVDVGDGSWVMSRKGSAGDISPAMAMVVALRALATDQPAEVWGFIG